MPTIRSLDPRTRETLLRELRELSARLIADLRVEDVYLFGSLARGEQHEGSDIDLLVVADYPNRSLDLIGEILRRTDLPIEPLVVRRETLERRVRDGHPLFTRIMGEAMRLTVVDTETTVASTELRVSGGGAMKYRDEVFKYQYPVVVQFVQHLAYYKGLKGVQADHMDAGEFWQATTASHLQLATVRWCMVFASRKEHVHWIHAPAPAALDQATQDFRDRLLSKPGWTKDEWEAYHETMRAFRDKCVAHLDLSNPFTDPLPSFERALQVAYEYQEWVRELIKPTLLGQPTLRSLYEEWKIEASSIAAR